MLVLLTSECCAYFLTPINQRLQRKLKKENGEDSAIIQTDWDYPALARDLGWDMRRVQVAGRKRKNRCDHGCTDGTINCSCGVRASDFIGAADEWLGNHCYHVFRADVGHYF